MDKENFVKAFTAFAEDDIDQYSNQKDLKREPKA